MWYRFLGCIPIYCLRLGLFLALWGAASGARAQTTLLWEDFSSAGLDGWLVVDEGDRLGPSDWSLTNGQLLQRSYIFSRPTGGADVTKRGTYAWWGQGTSWADYLFELTLRSEDPDAIGVLFRYADSDNYYRFSMDARLGYRRLVKVAGGQYSLLAEVQQGYLRGRAYTLAIQVEGPVIDVYMDGQLLMSVTDSSHAGGSVGLYCWANQMSFFDDVLVASLEAPDTACSQGRDSDGDRLDDCHETHTGRYVSPTDTGTDPMSADTDGDGLSDGDEVLGTPRGLDLRALGANPLRKDIFIEYDWFSDALDGCGGHSHQPRRPSVEYLQYMFEQAPVLNPDGSTGIRLHQDYGQGGVFRGGNRILDSDGVLFGGVQDEEFQAYKAAHFDARREGVFHYVILPHRYNGSSLSSGQAELYGDDIIVSMWTCPTPRHGLYYAQTIAHELGHNLGLRHGGFEDCNLKPNYSSLMNYRYQFSGVDTSCSASGNGAALDYSRGGRLDLDEWRLDERLGVCGAPGVDFDANGLIDSQLAYDLNRGAPGEPPSNEGCASSFSVLRDHDDWAHLALSSVAGSGFALRPVTVIDCDGRVDRASRSRQR